MGEEKCWLLILKSQALGDDLRERMICWKEGSVGK